MPATAVDPDHPAPAVGEHAPHCCPGSRRRRSESPHRRRGPAALAMTYPGPKRCAAVTLPASPADCLPQPPAGLLGWLASPSVTGRGTSPRARSTARSENIFADHIGGHLGAVRKGSQHRTGSLDDMRAGQHEAIGGQHTRAAGALAQPRPDPEARHARQDPLDHHGHRGGVGVHRLTVTIINHVVITRTGQKCSALGPTQHAPVGPGLRPNPSSAAAAGRSAPFADVAAAAGTHLGAAGETERRIDAGTGDLFEAPMSYER